MKAHDRQPTAGAAATACLVAVSVVCAQVTLADTTWTPRLSTGFDTYLHSYHLADDDTTETVAESVLTAELEGRSSYRATHAWRLRALAGGGSEVNRQLLDATYRWRPDGRDRLRCDLDWLARQYHGDDVSTSSDHHEGRAELRYYPWSGTTAQLDLRVLARYVDYHTPSTLQKDHDELGVGSFVTSRSLGDVNWRLGGRLTHRSYPDSSAIDREAVALEGDLDLTRGNRQMWLYHRTERRLAADDQVRPSAWSHWSELRAAWPAGQGRVITNLGSEVWRYDLEDEVWFDSWRLDTGLGYEWGDPLGTRWQTLLATERLAAGEHSEAYTQMGLRTSVEGYGGTVSGLLSLEYGHRWYDEVHEGDQSTDLLLAYTDFSYLEIWLMATWNWTARLGLELSASYQPEQHTERNDDTALGYASLRLVWRP